LQVGALVAPSLCVSNDSTILKLRTTPYSDLAGGFHGWAPSQTPTTGGSPHAKGIKSIIYCDFPPINGRSVASGLHHRPFPIQRVTNDSGKIIEAWVPAERSPDKLGFGYDFRGIARSAADIYNRKINA
jgi:hypothetical protein